MNALLFGLLFTILGALYLVIGYAASKRVKTVDDYFLAGRNLGLIPLTIALMATQLGGGVIIGTSREGFASGQYGLAYVIGITLGFIILSCGIASRLRSFNISTTAELFTLRYRSPLLTKIASACFIISLGGLLAAQVVASRNLMTSLGVYNEWFFLLFWLLVVGYTMMGGLRAIVHNDVFQLSLIIAVFVGIFAYEAWINPGSIMQTLCCSPCVFCAQSPWDLGRISAIIITPMLFSLIEQDVAQTLFAARTPRIALGGSLLAGIFMLLFAVIPVYFGMKTRLLGIGVPEGANPLLYFFDLYYPSMLVALVAYGVFAAIISTADALLCAISSHIVKDFGLSTGSSKTLWVAKTTTLIIGGIALISGRYLHNVIDVIVGSYDIPVSMLFVPLIIAYFVKKPSTYGAWASLIIGFSSFILTKATGIIPVPLPELVTLALATSAYVGGWLIQRYCPVRA